jgi:hypothetical protein
LHAKLRVALEDGPLRFAQLRLSYDISPITLLQDCIARFPDVYVESVDLEGHPLIGLRPGAPELAEMLDRQPLLELIREAGANGVYLASLHRHTEMSSTRIEQLLKDVANVERVVRDKRVLYRAKPELNVEKVPEAVPDLGVARDQLMTLLGDSNRDQYWLEAQMERAEIRAVLAEFANDFVVENCGSGNTLIGARVPCAPPAAVGGCCIPSAPQAPGEPLGPSELLADVIPGEDLETMRFRPAAPGMGLRKNGPVQMRGERHRARRPMVEI